MIFNILFVVSILVSLCFGIWTAYAIYADRWFIYGFDFWRPVGAFFGGVGTTVLSFIVTVGLSALISFFGAWATSEPEPVRSYTHELEAIGNDLGVEGRVYFLGGGYVNNVQVISYIQAGDGYSEIRSVAASMSRIYQDTAEPIVIEWWEQTNNTFWVPWTLSDQVTLYEFHVPEDSVVSNYEIGVN